MFRKMVRFRQQLPREECLEILKRRLADESYEIPSEQLKTFDKKILSRLARLRKAAKGNFGNAFAVNGIFNQIMDTRSTRFGELLDKKCELTADMLKTIDIEKDLPASEKEEN